MITYNNYLTSYTNKSQHEVNKFALYILDPEVISKIDTFDVLISQKHKKICWLNRKLSVYNL